MNRTMRITAFCLAAMAGAPAFAQTVKWDLSTEYNTNHHLAGGYELLVKSVAEKTSGQVQIFVHWGGALGFKSADHLDAVRNGAVPIADTYSGALSGNNPLFTLSSTPFVAPSIKQARALYEAAKPHYDAVFQRYNQVLLAASPFPPTGIWSKRPVTSSDQLKGLKIRTYDVMGQSTLRAAGAFPVQLSFTDVLPQLASGGVDAVLTSATGGASVKYWEHLPYFVEVNYAYPLQFLHVNLNAWKALSPAQRDAISKSANMVEERNWREVTDGLVRTHDTLRANKVNVTAEPPRDLQQGLIKAADTTIADWEQKVGPTAKELLAEYRRRM